MKRILLHTILLLVAIMFIAGQAMAQCSICTKTTMQLGKGAGQGFNTGIIYLMVIPFAIAGFIGWRIWKQQKNA